ncbi:MAG: ATP-binding protein [Candidatus Euphemobacter frigidus]|nr:ATP-binding protein [Candidatus Euphemobacter frigidus]MDP8276060.1 ATP-binding protein [Candidatus Euphemobacter frigidus]
MWEIISWFLAAVSVGLVVWLVVLLIKLKKVRFYLISRLDKKTEPGTQFAGWKDEGEMKDAFRRLESKYRFFFEESQTFNIIIGMDGKLLDLNRAFQNIFDREKDELIGKDILELAAPDQKEKFSAYLARHREDKYTSEKEVEFSGKQGARRILFGERHLTVVKDYIPVGILISGIDVTHLRRSEEQEGALKQKLALSGRMEMIGIMAGGIAHDLKNLFNPILSYPDSILEKLPPESPLRMPVMRIKDAAGQAAELVQNFLVLARRGRIDLQPVNINDIIRSYMRSMGFRTLKNRFPGVTIATRLSDELPPVMGMAPQLLCVIMNLVRNGCEAMEVGGELEISTYRHTFDSPHKGLQQIPRGEYAVIKVSDSGKGIKKEDLDRIFTPFTSEKEMGSSGSGLGLAVVTGVIEDLHGYLDVQSELGRGTDFYIYLRSVAQAPPVAHPAQTDQARPAGAAGERILILDNSEELDKT